MPHLLPSTCFAVAAILCVIAVTRDVADILIITTVCVLYLGGALISRR